VLEVEILDIITMTQRMVFRNRRRYRAVIAAIALGTIGFIIIRTMGDSVEGKLAENLEILGEATVLKAEWRNHFGNLHPGEFQMRDVERLKKIPHVMAVAPVASVQSITATYRRSEKGVEVHGVDSDYWRTQTPHLLSGRLFNRADFDNRERVCVVGKEVVRDLFRGADPIGQYIRIDHIWFRVVGVLGGLQHDHIRSGVFVPITTARNIFKGLDSLSTIYIRVNNWDHVEPVYENALSTLQELHKGYEDGLHIFYYPARVKRVKMLVYVVNIFVYASLAIVFVLGKVGLTNVMLAAVQDRTREIGLRKAVGATDTMIRLQFLLESVLVSLTAGIAGVVLGILCVNVLKDQLGVEVSHYVMSTSIIIDLAVTTLIGVFAGLYPSLQASRLDIVTAMRFE
jgi:putative ABC transport system permease protein